MHVFGYNMDVQYAASRRKLLSADQKAMMEEHFAKTQTPPPSPNGKLE